MGRTLVSGLHEPEARLALAQALGPLFSAWELEAGTRSALLGLPEGALPGPDAPLPDEPRVLERAGELLAIGRLLQRLYPYRPERRDRWIAEPEEAFGGRTPLAVMLAEGREGIAKVRIWLEVQASHPGSV